MLHSAYRVKLARIERTKTRPRPLQVDHFIEHGHKLWLDSVYVRTYLYVLLHAILVVHLTQKFRYDEIHKFKIGSVDYVLRTVG